MKKSLMIMSKMEKTIPLTTKIMTPMIAINNVIYANEKSQGGHKLLNL